MTNQMSMCTTTYNATFNTTYNYNTTCTTIQTGNTRCKRSQNVYPGAGAWVHIVYPGASAWARQAAAPGYTFMYPGASA